VAAEPLGLATRRGAPVATGDPHGAGPLAGAPGWTERAAGGTAGRPGLPEWEPPRLMSARLAARRRWRPVAGPPFPAPTGARRAPGSSREGASRACRRTRTGSVFCICMSDVMIGRPTTGASRGKRRVAGVTGRRFPSIAALAAAGRPTTEALPPNGALVPLQAHSGGLPRGRGRAALRGPGSACPTSGAAPPGAGDERGDSGARRTDAAGVRRPGASSDGRRAETRTAGARERSRISRGPRAVPGHVRVATRSLRA
jgi:hypothetical protein